MADTTHYEVIIIGGSYAGLSAAMSLGRSMRKVLVIDSGKPCNIQTPHSHNFITHDGKAPHDIAMLAKEEVLKYDTVQFHDTVAVAGRKTDNGFEIEIETGHKFTAERLLFATGVRDILPDIKGLRECWGITVIHCPYCHGYEFRGKETAILATGEKAMHTARMVSNLTDKLSIIAPGIAEFTEEQKAKLHSKNITLTDAAITEVGHENGRLKHIVFADGSTKPLDALYIAPAFVQHCDVPEKLGCELTEPGFFKIDEFHKTTVPGVYACGDSTAAMRSIANAVAQGNVTGAMVNMDLCDAKF